ncbi:hypothetical protein [Legionella nagasakiensis]|uniref:hypothetical protein n=1 Tax=Legionella nagasakiensis TaxID=535290 RepID=UPI0010546A0E|nr:hypothetical protein [Legionella nagasakiensis]
MSGDADRRRVDAAKAREANEILRLLRAKMEENAKDALRESQIGAAERTARREKKTANADQLWDEVDKTANSLVKQGNAGYDSWVSAMARIIENCRLLGEAINKSDPMGKIFLTAHNKLSEILSAVKYQNAVKAAQEYTPQDSARLQDSAELYEKAREFKIDLNKVRREIAAEEDAPAPPPSLTR